MLTDGKRLFGTDGVRGVANQDLTPEFVFDLGRAAGSGLSIGPVLVGQDTRRSGAMLSASIQSGFHSVGIDTLDVGVLPSGGIATLTAETDATMGIVISASHNPAPDNGVKLLRGNGHKLTDEQEDEIEFRLKLKKPFKRPVGGEVGTRYPMPQARGRYVAAVAKLSTYSLRGLPITLDCANGAAYEAAPELFAKLGADLSVIHAEPDGTNINLDSGATHTESLRQHCEGSIGLAFDGDADRLIAIDEKGRVANGDVIMAILAKSMLDKGELRNNRVVSTVMANLGFRRAMENLGIDVVQTPVGDRYVMAALKEHEAVLGGEQSGHIILRRLAPTGDGLLTAVKLLDVVAGSGRTLAELRDDVITEYPQVLRNVKVENTHALDEAEKVWASVRDAELTLGQDGRVLVRASGTEPLIRVMVEAMDRESALQVVDSLVAVVQDELA